MNSNDPHFQVGAPVHAKQAMHVTALVECHRRYGSNAKTKLVNGTVSEIKTAPSSTQKRAVTLVTAIYTLGGQCKKVATLNSRSVKAGHVAAIPDEGSFAPIPSYFASVGAAEELFRNGLRFIGIVKTATRGFPKSYLSSVELESRGDFFALKRLAGDNKPALLGAFVWMDREHRYFISTAGTLEAGTPYVRLRWRQADQAPNAAPEQVTFSIQQPKIAEVYYSTCAAIDMHNRLRQDDLRIEKEIETKDWSMRVNLSIFLMIVVDTWLVYSTFKNTPASVGYNQKERPRSSLTGRSFQDACIKALESGPATRRCADSFNSCEALKK